MKVSLPSLLTGFVLILTLSFVPGCNKVPSEQTGTTPESSDSDSPSTPSVDGTQPVAEIEEIPEATFGTDDWPMWRGPNLNGIAHEQAVPSSWSDSENIAWKTEIPGRGHSSPTVVGDRIYLATADEKKQTQSVLCLERSSGKPVWEEQLYEGAFPTKMHNESSHATGTVACDGERLFIAFCNHDTIHVAGLDLNGKTLWKKEVGNFDSKFGYAPSPTLYKSLVIVAADHRSGGYLVALHRKSGEIVWKADRPKIATYSSAVVANVSGKDQLLISGAFKTWSYDPLTGKENWSVEGTAEATCGTVVWGKDVVFASGGWPESDTLCVKADGSGKILWRKKDKAYVASMLLHDGHLYAVNSEQGIGYCWNAETGDLKWKERLPGGKIRSSPVLVGEKIYLTNVKGTTYVIKANPDKFEKLAQNQLGDECYSTPSVCGGKIYLRVADSSSGSRKETLYCIGQSGAQ